MDIHFDGSSSPHKKDGAGWAFVVLDGDKLLSTHSGVLPPATTNNMAELRAATEALKYAWSHGEVGAVLGDSKVILGWIDGRYKVRLKGARSLVATAQSYLRDIRQVCRFDFDYIRRDKNKADKAAKEAKNL